MENLKINNMNQKDFIYWAKGFVANLKNNSTPTEEQWDYFKNTLDKVEDKDYDIKVSFATGTDTKSYITSVTNTTKVF